MNKKKRLLQTIDDNEIDLLDRVHALIDDGADVSAVTGYQSPLRAASHNGRFDVVKLLLDSGAEESQLGWSRSFFEVAFGSLASLTESIRKHGDIENRDCWQRTPWLLSVQIGDMGKASCLLNLGANRHVVGAYERHPMAYAIQHNNLDMLKWLIEKGCDIEAIDQELETPLITASKLGMTAFAECLIDHGADIYKQNDMSERAIEVASNLDIVQMLVKHGDDINGISEETRALLTGTRADGKPKVSRQEYMEGKNRRFGVTNPEQANVKFWFEMIKSGAIAAQARRTYSSIWSSGNAPVWCYKRFGRSITVLDNGCIIEIAGEHEDSYDCDFCIYNDVVVFDGNGKIEIFIYPEHVFPPTDFHTATLAGEYIYIIGSLGYEGARTPGHTPVYRLSIASMKIEKVDTTGQEPGWISEHKACLKDESTIILKGGRKFVGVKGKRNGFEKNINTYELCITNNSWRLLD
ncbi:MAG: ankyrin repeat domain-containing protein [Phycisphaerales bacterium]|jgi:hypothetical protein|nr:ankyrin repeat domain-containing protein [Phycisphaerales bacterium]